MASTYETSQGDTWDLIAFKELGACAFMKELMNANYQYRAYTVFPAGIRLQLPDVTKTAVADLELPPWKR